MSAWIYTNARLLMMVGLVMVFLVGLGVLLRICRSLLHPLVVVSDGKRRDIDLSARLPVNPMAVPQTATGFLGSSLVKSARSS